MKRLGWDFLLILLDVGLPLEVLLTLLDIDYLLLDLVVGGGPVLLEKYLLTLLGLLLLRLVLLHGHGLV